MTIISEQYTSPSDAEDDANLATLAENIDSAWTDYNNATNTEDKRKDALNFLAYVFDLDVSKKINEQLIELMAKRFDKKVSNPEYVPRQGAKRLANVEQLKLQGYPNEEKVKSQTTGFKTAYLDMKDRSRYRTIIKGGEFYQQGNLVHTLKLKSHGKVDYIAYTLNNNGELSLFPHSTLIKQLDEETGAKENKTLLHSSMNAGKEVICAGELIIENGNLKAINTSSGHYKPKLFNVYKMLCHFANKGVDLSQVKVLTNEDPGIAGEIKQLKGGYETNALTFIRSMEKQFKKAISSIQKDISSYQSSSITNFIFSLKDKITGSTLTSDRAKIAKRVKTVSAVLELSDNFYKNKLAVKELKGELKKLKAENNKLSRDNLKSENSGRLNRQIDACIKHLDSARDEEHLSSEELSTLGMKH